MKKRVFFTKIVSITMVSLMMTMLGGCGSNNDLPQTSDLPMTIEPVSPSEPVPDNEPADTNEQGESDELQDGAAENGRLDGERFGEVIIVEGMEETVKYEHVRNEALGFEMDYDYERFIRHKEINRDSFISIYDVFEKPENYLEVTYSREDADTVSVSIGEKLSKDYDIIKESFMLDHVGSCIRIDASDAKGGGGTPDLLQMVYIIPATDGSLVATAHYSFESAEGFGRRFAYIMNTLVLIDRNGENKLTDEQALSAIQSYCYQSNPDLEDIVNSGEYPVYWSVISSDEQTIVVLFRSYTGAEIRYYIDSISGETYVTEFVPGITPEEERTDESFNVWDYLSGQDTLSGTVPSIAGTWQTASMRYEDDGTVFPEYDVQFTDSDIIYGHMKDGIFTQDHADKIISLEATATGGFKVQAKAANGIEYTYRTCENDKDVLEYYETWMEEDFPEMYRGGASLSKKVESDEKSFEY
ncbi:MAG: hypothetical protein K6G30_15825 [Acetatifactor sp.]|nr:hypothetical protein [Acetatifactor sp.]